MIKEVDEGGLFNIYVVECSAMIKNTGCSPQWHKSIYSWGDLRIQIKAGFQSACSQGSLILGSLGANLTTNQMFLKHVHIRGA